MLRRRRHRARNDFEINGITREVCFGDLERRDESGNITPFDKADSEWEKPFYTTEYSEPANQNPNPVSPKLMSEALDTLTPKQHQALILYMEDIPERRAAERMGISQPTYHEIIHGRQGIGGVIKKLKKHFTKNTLSNDY